MIKNRFENYFKKRVSYILTTKNRAKFLDKALLSYRRLIKDQDELIIVDGDSKDKTASVVKKYKDLVDIFVSESDRSATQAFNKGILLASGMYIKNLNDDDEIYPGAMEKAIEVMEKHPEVDLLVCGGTKENNGIKSLVYLPKGVNYGSNCEDIFRYGACGVGFVIRRRSIANFGLCTDILASDVALVLEYIKGGGVVKFCRINLYNHPIYKHSMAVAKTRQALLESFDLAKVYGSGQFYWRYRAEVFLSYYPINLEKLYRQFPILRTFLFPARFLYGQIVSLVTLKHFRSNTLKNEQIVWDGGFS